MDFSRLKLDQVLVEKKVFLINANTSPLECAKVEGFVTEVIFKEIKIEKSGSNSTLIVPLILRNATDKSLSFCETVYSYSPFNPSVIIELDAKSGLKKILPRHGSGFGPDYYPEPTDTVTYTIYKLPSKSETVIAGRSRVLEQYYEIKNPKDLQVIWSTSVAGGHKGAFDIDLKKIPVVSNP